LVAYKTGLLKLLRIVGVAFDRVTQRQMKQSPVEKECCSPRGLLKVPSRRPSLWWSVAVSQRVRVRRIKQSRL